MKNDDLYSNIKVLDSLDAVQPGAYDLLVVPGYGFVGDNYELSEHVINRVGLAANLYKQGIAAKIALIGRWSITWERQGIIPPMSEARRMQQLLLTLGVPEDATYVEEKSMDSVGNTYYLKNDIVRPNHYHRVLILIADYILERAKYCYGKMFEDEDHIDLLPTETPYTNDQNILAAQTEMSAREQAFLDDMQKGDDAYWARFGYDHPHYQQQRPALVDKVGLGGNK